MVSKKLLASVSSADSSLCTRANSAGNFFAQPIALVCCRLWSELDCIGLICRNWIAADSIEVHVGCIITPPARSAWRSYKFASLKFSGFFLVSQVGIRLYRYVTRTNVSFFNPSPNDQRTEHSCA